MVNRFGKALVIAAIVFCLGLIAGLPRMAVASPYGSGSYGSCNYQQSCPPPPTTVVTPTGLQVSINLTNGQTIPLKGYKIVITPLNGQGKSFKQAAIYVNSVLVQTVTPAENGTASWLWIPKATGKTAVKIVITDTNGATTTHNFSVIVKNTATTSGPTPAAPSSPVVSPPKHGLAAIVQSVSNGARHVINKAAQIIKGLPAPVVHSFPYILFVLLGINALLLLIQTQRELHEYHALRALLARARSLDEDKRTFTALASHYLRTPLTVISGGIDLLSADKTLISSDKVDLKAVAGHMKQQIESVIAQTQTLEGQVVQGDAPVNTGDMTAWRQRGLFVPILLIGVVLVVFDYLVKRAGNFSVGQVELAVQAIVFAALVLAMYLVFRQRQFHHHNTAELQRIVASETAVGEARDSLIASTVEVLDGDLAQLDRLVPRLGSTSKIQAIQNGQRQFHEVLTKFAVAGRLRGASSDQAFTSVRLGSLLDDATAGLQPRIATKGITIKQPEASTLSIQEPELVTYVLSSVLDNAVVYSQNRGSIEVAAEVTPAEAIIAITDHGSGIPSDKLPLLFQPFSKVEGAEVFTHAGMGFSLYLDKLIMAYLGGAIELASASGSGTTITLRLPQRPPGALPVIVGVAETSPWAAWKQLFPHPNPHS